VLEPLYWGISWILLQWHALWHLTFQGGQFLVTNWDWVLAIVFLVLTIRVALFPVFVKQIKSQRAMQALAPQIKALQEKHKGDRESLQKEMMELYRREKANPLMGCLPMLVQIPVMWALFHVLRHLSPNTPAGEKGLYGWTTSLFDSASHAKLFGAPIAATFKSSGADLALMHANGLTVKIVAGILVAIMIATTYLTSRQMILKTGWAEDPQQKLMQRLMLYGIPISLLFSGTLFPIGVVIYWTTTNIFSLGQQYWVLRKYPPPPMASKAGGTTPTKTAGTKATTAKADTSVLSLADRVLGRKPKPVEPTTPKVDTKALGPKPGAKPVNPKKAPTKATNPGAAQTTPAKAAPTKATPAKANGTAKSAGAAKGTGAAKSANKSGSAAKAKRPTG
jgi:YidC/Oxa1 family membrane protein insertase